MILSKRAFLLFAAGMFVLAGKVSADDKAQASKTPAPAAKSSKGDSPTVTAMKAAIALADEGKTDEAVAAYEKMGVLKSSKMEAWRLNNEGLAYLTAKEPKNDKALALFEKAVAAD